MKVLLHICCGICAAGAAERLLSEGHEVTGYFYNPNIYPESEYRKRLEATEKVARELGIKLIEGPFDTGAWHEAVKGYENEPEGGKRCELCFRYRLEKTFSVLSESGCEAFTTTLTISPHKPAPIVNAIGIEIGGDTWLVKDFKKKAGFERANTLSRQLGIYRQDYCGCEYSKNSY